MKDEQLLIFDYKADKLKPDYVNYFEGFKDCIQFLSNHIFKEAEMDLYKTSDHVMRYPMTKLLNNMSHALEEKLVDELFSRMDNTIQNDDQDIPTDMDEDDYLIDVDEDDDFDLPFLDNEGNEEDD